ncbi:hypothetical protein Pmar_PMAR020721 [Perkinsus marinus ATCC 50983]|uniref:Uncharacterized protein n=1 Tax=Perkinsus marinus (strain ATCC 50983 / TXsc) TaxID=423536 RepID=C5KVX9_PERM5|nr:hypothetical protein Pmar_PMAR020721 [Perkinsus marinus ATCC 50983]EER11370.1 hypothetical protein Pmar_PMAR020721 [Perkinsus marinus ATCC 50983]|eukprot:XP_002779575.1 hypothetical protein Pmar_PMAR020721 [Perkinsus marinus ATCC 50983]
MVQRGWLDSFNHWFHHVAVTLGETVAAVEMDENGKAVRNIGYCDLYKTAYECGVMIRHNLELCGLSKYPYDRQNFPRGVVALNIPRGIDWYTVYLACLLAGIPTVSLTSGGTEASATQETASCKTTAEDCLREYAFGDRDTVAYHFTGGTTASSKCVRITLGMVMHELEKYAEVIPKTWKGVGRTAILSAPSMGDSKLSPMDKTEGPFRLIKHAMISGRYDTVIAGLVPTLMDAMPSPEEEWWTRGTTIRKKKLLVFTWGEACPQSLVDKWSSATLIELLVATEYWLSLFCIRSVTVRGCRTPSVRYATVSGCDVSAKPLSSTAEAGTMVMRGRMVTPGYVTEPLHTAPSIEEIPLAVDGMVESIATFETEDVIRFVKDSENGDSSPYVECLGREGDLIKVGGAFAAIPALEGTISQKFGSGTKVYLMVAHEVLGGEIHVVVQVGYECRLSVPEAIAAVRANDAIPEDASYREAYELGGGLSVKSAASISILASICWNSVQPVRLILSILAALMVYYPLLDYGAITVQSDTAPVFGSSIDTKDCLERMAMRWAEVERGHAVAPHASEIAGIGVKLRDAAKLKGIRNVGFGRATVNGDG